MRTARLEIAVRTNGSGPFTLLAPLQPITPTPYAIAAGNLTGGGAVITGLNSPAALREAVWTADEFLPL